MPNVFAQEADAVLLKILKTGDINAALSYIRNNSTEPAFREIATQLLIGGMGDYSVFMFADEQDLVKAQGQGRLNAEAVAELTPNTMGFIPTKSPAHKNPTIFIRNSDEVKPTEEIVLHESIHAYIYARYRSIASYTAVSPLLTPDVLRRGNLTEAQATKSLLELRRLHEDFSKAVENNIESLAGFEVLQTMAAYMDEFLTYGLTNKSAQALLRMFVYNKRGKLVYTGQTVDAKADSVWSRLLDWIADLLFMGSKIDNKAETKNALNYLMDASQVMFKESRQDPPDMKFTKAITEYVASKPLTVKAVENIDAPLQDSVVTALNAGDLAGALKALGATGKNKSIGFMARALLRAVGGTKVEVVTGLVDGSGNPVAGLFDPITNTIKLDSKTGVNSHAVLHEMTHAAVSAVLANPSHPVTRQLTALFNAVKDKLGTAYGAQNLDEFVAEAFTNKVFQQKLAMLLQPNEKISVWGKFVNTISNFVRNLLGLPSKQQDIKTMDELHRAILSIMAPAPESRFAGELYMAQVDVNLEAIPSVSSVQARNFLQVMLDKGSRTAKKLVMYFTPLIPLEQIAKKYIPMATQISKAILEQDGYAKRIHDILSDTAAAITKWAGNNQTKYKEFSDLVNTSTREEVDARLTDKEAEKKYKNDIDKQKLRAALRYEYLNKLDDVGRKLYGDTFDAYMEIRNEHFSVLKNKILETVGVDANQADILAKNLEAKLMALGYIDPYAKLGRPDGKYFLTFNAVDPTTGKKELYFEIFTSEFVREKRLAELVADKKNVDQASIERTTRGDNTDYKNRAPDTSFIKSVLKVLEDNNVNKEVEDDILALFLDSMPEKAYLKGLAKERTGTLGYVDVVSTLKQQAFASATHLSRLKYNTEFRRLKTKLAEYAETARYSSDADTINLYAGRLKEHIDFALNPSVEDWAKLASSIGFNFGLGFNVSGFFINLSAFGTLIHPYLAGKYAVGGANYKKAWGDTTRAMGVGFSVFRNSGSFAAPDVNKYRVGLEHYDFSRADIPSGVKMFSTLQNRMKELGQFSRTEVEDELNLGAYGNALGGNLAKLNRASGWFMSQSERILRQTTTIATYQLELAKQLKIPVSGLAAAFAAGKITPEMQLAAADEAVLVAELVNSGTMAQTSAEFSKSGFGKVASLFRRYSLNTFSILLKLSRDSVYGTAEDKKMARQQLAGIFGNTAIIAGVGGVPFFGSLALLYDLFTDDDEDDLETATRKMMGEKVYGGLASYLLGSSISSRIGFSDFIFRETYVDKDSPYMWRLALQLGGPLVGMASQFETSAKLIGRGEIRRGMEAAAPSFARNLLKAQRFYAEGPQTVAGDQVAPPIDVRETIMQGLGFPPSDYIQLLEQNAASSKMDRYASELRSDIYTRYYRARKENDVEALARIQEEVEEYRAKFPGYPIRQQDLQASYKRRNRISKEKIAGLTVNRNLESQIQEERDEWDEASSIWDDLFEAEEDTEE